MSERKPGTVCVVYNAFDSHGGAQRVVAEDLKMISRNGCETHLLASAVSEDVLADYGVPEDVTIHEYSAGGSIELVQTVNKAVAFNRQFRAIRPDVVYSHYNNMAVYLAGTLPGPNPLLATHIHGTILWLLGKTERFAHEDKGCYRALLEEVPGHTEFQPQEGVSRVERWNGTLKNAIRMRALRRAEIFTNTNHLRRELACLYSVDSVVTRPGVSGEWLSRYDSVDEIDLTDSEYTILSVSRLDERKRLDLLIEAFAGVFEERQDVSLLICGTGDERTRLEDLVSELDLRDAVRFEGHVPEETLVSYYKSADLFTAPGWISYGIAPLEAYGMGTPVLLSEDAYAKEVLSGAPGVWTVSPTREAWAEALLTAIDERPDVRREIVPTWSDYHRDKWERFERMMSN